MDLEDYAESNAAKKPPTRSKIWGLPPAIAIQVVYSDVSSTITADWVLTETGVTVSGDSIVNYRNRYRNNPIFDKYFDHG